MDFLLIIIHILSNVWWTSVLLLEYIEVIFTNHLELVKDIIKLLIQIS